MNTCIVIPNYNHGETINALLLALECYNLPCVIIDDGSNETTKQHLKRAVENFSWVTLQTLPKNLGKGGAVTAGLRYAKEKGYTHAIQIDADGQHNPQDIPKFVKAIQENPDALIVGVPVYDESIPKSRLYGRLITNFWVCIETLSLEIKDSMCGFRAYPLAVTNKILENNSLGTAMDFDTSILVRLYWQRYKVVNIPTKVIYPEKGISHFRLWKDNVKISWMHTRLVCGMLIRLPSLLYYIYLRRQHRNSQKHWSGVKEKGCLWGLRFVLFTYKIIGRHVAYLLLYPIIVYFYCFSSIAKKASRQYISYLNASNPEKKYNHVSSFKHFLAFSQSMLDKLSVWNGDISLSQVNFPGLELFYQQRATNKGAVILTAHLGNIEIARCLSRFMPDVKINALVFTGNAKNFNTVLEQINPECKLNMIEVDMTDIKLAIDLKEKIDNGEFIFIVGDRTSISNNKRTTEAKFLKHTANFAQGPFILAGLLQCPVYFMLCLKNQDHRTFNIIFEKFAETINIKRAHREQQLNYHTQKYADLLSLYCQQYPLQWFNFYEFWGNNND